MADTPMAGWDEPEDPAANVEAFIAGLELGQDIGADFAALLERFGQERVAPAVKMLTDAGVDPTDVLRSFVRLLRTAADGMEAQLPG